MKYMKEFNFWFVSDTGSRFNLNFRYYTLDLAYQKAKDYAAKRNLQILNF